MVASAHPYATVTGLDVLRAGGTAADAAIATNAVLAVTQPNMCGVGGDLFVLYYEAATRRVHFLNGAGRSGSRASLEELKRRGAAALPVVGAMTVSVPGCVRGWGMLLERFGTRPLASLLGPAIHYAEGFETSSLTRQAIDEFASLTPDTEWHRVFRPAGRASTLGEPLVQSDLARTLRDLGSEGPDLFYTGRVGRAIAERMATDGFLTADDLADHTGEWGEPIATTYRGFRVYETPPPTQGLAALIALNILERFPLARRPLHSVQHLHLLLEVVKLAYADRDRWIGDPAHARVPVAELLDKKYAVRRRKAFDARKAQAYTAGDPEGDTTASSSSTATATWRASSRASSTRSGPASSCRAAASCSRTAAATSSSIPRTRARWRRASGRSHADGLDRHARRAPGPRAVDDGRQRPGAVPRADPHQPDRLRPGSPGSHRAAALPVRSVLSGGRAGHDPPREPAAARRRLGPRAQGPCDPAGARVLHAHGPGPRDQLPRWHHARRRRPAR